MRKIILLIAFATCSVAMFGQFAFGIKAGYNTSLGFDKDWNFDASNVISSPIWGKVFMPVFLHV